ncbi:MAG TPA: hypothetical protein VGG33_24105 [Polyangia bacterium]
MPQPGRRLAFVSSLPLFLIGSVIGGAACNTPTVVSTERAPGNAGSSGGLAGGAGTGAGSGSGSGSGSGGTSGGIVLPDAAPAPDVASMAMACATEAHKAEAVPLDLMLLVDASGSMDTRVGVGMATKWVLAQNALMSFVRDPRSAGLGIGLQFFPHQKTCMVDTDCGTSLFSRCRGRNHCVDAAGTVVSVCPTAVIGPSTCAAGLTCVSFGTCSLSAANCTNPGQPCPNNEGMCEAGPKTCTSSTGIAECDVANYETPAVAIAPLPGSQLPLVRALREKAPSGGTPMRVAVEGALKQLRAHLDKNPGRKAVLVLASDGLPSCGPVAMHGIPAIAELVGMANMATPSIPTYVVGVFGQSEIATARPQLDMVATAGGTNQAFVITASDDLAMRLQEALDTIRGAALSCEFKIPAPKTGTLDFAKVNVRYTPTGGNGNDLGYVRSMAGCDPTRGGWYYDVDPAMGTPTRILVCPSTCETFKKDGTAKVDLLFGCATKVD